MTRSLASMEVRLGRLCKARTAEGARPFTAVSETGADLDEVARQIAQSPAGRGAVFLLPGNGRGDGPKPWGAP